MSEFTTTPNLGLFKPNFNGDDGLWASHLNSNADRLDQVIGPNPGVGPFLPISGGTMTGTLNVNVSALFGLTMTGTTNLRVHAADTGSAALQFYKASAAASGHRWDILTGPASGGALLQALAYDDTGAQRSAALFQANRYSGFGNQGNPWWAIAPFTMGYSRATAPNGNIGADFGGGTGFTDVQPTTTLGNNPIAVTSGLANAWITWTGSGAAGGPIGAVNTTSETWVNLNGATTVGGITVSGWYKATRIDNNSFRIDTATAATSSATGGGAAVTVQPSFGTSSVQAFTTVTTSATTFPLQDRKLFVVNPAFYQPLGGKGPNYQQLWSQMVTAPDKTGTNQFIHIGWEQDLVNRGGDFGYAPEAQTALNLTAAIWLAAIDAVPTYAAGGGTAQNWNMGIVFGGLRTAFYNPITIQPRALVGASEDPTGHGGVGLDFFGDYVTLQPDPFNTTSGTNVVTVHPVLGAAVRQSNGDIFTLPAAVTVNGVTLAAGDYAMSAVDPNFFNIVGTGLANATGAGGGTGLYGYFPKDAPYAPAQWWGQWRHGIITKNAKFVSGGIIETQPGNGLLWGDGTGTASINSVAPSPGNVDVVLTAAGSGTVRAVSPLRLRSYTVATLPAANAAYEGAMAYVTDATAPTYNGALTGGGAIKVPVFCNGAAWLAH